MLHNLICFFLVTSCRIDLQEDSLKLEQRKVVLTERAITVLNENIGKWSLCGSNYVVYDDRGTRVTKRYADLIAGDFNGDGRQDFAVLINTATNGYLVALLASDSTYGVQVIDSSGCNDGTIIDLVPEGTTEYDLITKTPHTYTTDAIGFGYYEKSGGTYFFQDGRFRYLSTSD